VIEIKRNIIFMAFILLFLSVAVGNHYSASKLTVEESIDQLFESNIYDEAKKKYGVNGIGVGKNEKVFSVTLAQKYEDNKEGVKSYFENQLSSRDIENYEVQVFINN
jgi:hypothetical protein